LDSEGGAIGREDGRQPAPEGNGGEGIVPGKLAELLQPGGRLSRLLDGYEQRPGQVRMLEQVCRLLERGGVLAVEAGTGVGKSLAYGIPAAAFALARGRRVVISSATINLQEQLVGKDLPLVGRLLGRSLRFELVKGRGNYLCRRRLADAWRRLHVSQGPADGEQLARLVSWAENSDDGSLASLDFRVDEELWERVSSDADACLGMRCPRRGECFFARARARAERAQLLVVNHHLLLADLAVRLDSGNWEKRAVLPSFGHLVVDEAHELEDAASSFFGVRITARGMARLLGRLAGRRGRAGLLDDLAREIESLGGALAGGRAQRLRQSTGELQQQAREVEQAYRRGLEQLGQLLQERRQQGTESKLRLDRLSGDDYPAEVDSSLREAADRLRQLAGQVALLVERLGELGQEESVSAEALAWVERARLLAEHTDLVFSREADEQVRWAESQRGGQASLHAAPVELAPLFRQVLFENMEAVVLTSATLTVGGDFEFFHERLGLDGLPPQRLVELVVESPFTYREQARLAIPADLIPPGQPGYEQALADAVVQAVAVSGGAALVLYTSWGTMRRVAERVAGRLGELGLQLLVQGQARRDELLERLRQGGGVVLFGVDSFWRGIDVVGPALRHVVITRLPFDVPGEPLIEARGERLEARGLSAFRHFSLPRAVLRLKQGFGRLIRSRGDRGVVTLLDRRVLERSYGREFLASLPPARRLVGPAEDVFDELAEFFGSATSRRVVPLE